MSAVEVSHKVTPRVGGLQKKRVRPERTAVSQLFQANEDTQEVGRPGSPKLSPVDKTVLSLELFNQQNGIVKADERLAYKPLPPVKVSYQSNKKFTESPKGDASSRIIRPHLTVKTYAPGHHIFTEGISRNSEMPNPTFALEKIGVPYSNLPDSISIFKEKDKFAFGLRREDIDKSPYRLSPRPTILGTAQILNPLQKAHVPPIECEDYNSEDSSRDMKAKTNRSSVSLKSNLVKLQPLTGLDNDEPLSYTCDIGAVKAPLAYLNEFIPKESERQDLDYAKANDNRSEKRSERKLSVVSVGETLAPDFHERSKREMRQNYPMYNNRSRKIEEFHKDKFGNQERYRARPQVPNSTFTYKISTRGHTFVDESNMDKFKPIRNNIKDKHGHPMHSYRGMVRYSDDADSMTNSFNDNSFRGYHSRSFHLPKSAGSGGSDMTHLPGNPPPSETSHQISEDGAPPQPLLVNDLRSGMVTLHEERTMTASMMEETDRHLVNSYAEEINTPVPEDDGDTEKDIETSRTAATFTTTDTDLQYQAVLRRIEETKTEQVNTGQTSSSRLNTALSNINRIDTARTNASRNNTGKTSASRITTNKTNVKRTNTSKTNASRNNTAQTNVSRVSICKLDGSRNSTGKSNDSRLNTGKTNVTKHSGVTRVSNGNHTETSSVGKFIVEAEERIRQERLGDLLEAGQQEHAGIKTTKDETCDDLDDNCDEENQSNNSKREDENMNDNVNVATSDAAPYKMHQDNDINKSLTTLTDKNKTKLPPKQCLNVPKHSFNDSLSWHPALPNISDRTTSLSRKIQNMTVVNRVPVTSEHNTQEKHVETGPVLVPGKGNVASVPITRLRLFSAASSASTSVVSICGNSMNTDDVKHDVKHNIRGTEASPEDEDRLEPTVYLHSTRKVINNANVSFIYPFANEVKAKRH